MKIITTLIIGLNFLYTSYGQDYLPFPDSAAIWVNALYGIDYDTGYSTPSFFLEETKSYCVDGEDTLIEEVNYTVIKYCNGVYKGALRQESGKVYYVPKDSLSAFLLYDFTVELGELLEDVYVENFWGYSADLYDMVVSNVDIVTVGGLERKKIRFEGGGGCWIEGIGNDRGLFLENWDNVSQYFIELYCMSHYDTSYVQNTNLNTISGSCVSNIGLREYINQKEDVVAYPNPSSTVFNLPVKGELLREDIEVKNLIGETIFPVIITTNSGVQVNLESYPNGVYILKKDVQYQSTLMKIN